MFLLMPRKSICVMFNALKKPFRAMSCWGDSWRRVLPWQLLNHLSGSCLWVLLRFRASRSSWTCPPVLRHICGPCRPGRGREQTQPFGDPRCDRNKSSVSSSPKRTSEWQRERDAGLFLCDLLTVMHVCMNPSRSALYVTQCTMSGHMYSTLLIQCGEVLTTARC